VTATETVYGLGADATNDRAVAGIFAAKGRPHFNPLICHYESAEAVFAHVEADGRARALAEAFWPGPLTLVLPRLVTCPVALLAGAGLETLAVRVPADATALALLRATGRPVAAPSANRSGQVSPTTAAHVLEGLGAGITPAQAEAARGLRSPGLLVSHYAPGLPVRLDAGAVAPDEALLAFGPALPGAAVAYQLSEGRDLVEAAARLFAGLRELDARGAGLRGIAVMPIPAEGLGEAINDRLQRAAAPRP
jgi:L-threonylcarbamoyladenylate synthase